ncbi:MAG: class I adenylate-forming enzyme family protein [Vicinamibacteria bacterium]
MRTRFAAQLARHAANSAASPAFALPDAEVSFAELVRRVDHCAKWLRAEGCGASDLVGVTVADDIAHLTVCYALLTLGVPQFCLPTFEPAAVREKLARLIGVTRVVAVEPGHGVPGLAASFLTPAFLARPREVAPQEALVSDPESPVLFVASSGSTGEPKIIAMSERVLTDRLRLRGYRPGERGLVLTTAEDIFGKTPRLFCAWFGMTSVFRGSAAAMPVHALPAFCARHRVTRLSTGVLHATTLVRDDGPALPAGLGVYTGGARVPMRLREAFRARGGARLYVEYGTREVGLIAATFPEDRDPSLESVGPIAEQAVVEIVDAEGRRLPDGEIGEVRVRTSSMIAGYHRNPAASARNFRDGWFHTGDLGSFSPRGSLCLVGRLDDVMNLNGIKVYPSEIETMLESDPAVRTAAAFALRSELHGEIPVAAVEWQGDARPDAVALLSRARAELGVRAPRKIVVVDALPRTATGKVARRELAGLISEKP